MYIHVLQKPINTERNFMSYDLKYKTNRVTEGVRK